MADNIIFSDTGTGAVPNATVVRSRQTSSGQQIQWADVAPAVLSTVAGGQYALSVSSTAVKTLTVPATATHALVSVDTGALSIRWTRDGTAPTASVGHILAAGEYLEIDNLSNFRCVAVSGSSTIQVSYHRYV